MIPTLAYLFLLVAVAALYLALYFERRRSKELSVRIEVLEALADYDTDAPDQPAPGGETRLDFSVVEDAARARAARERAR